MLFKGLNVLYDYITMLLATEHVMAALKESDWLIKGRSVFKTFKFETFAEAVSFVNAIADLADQMRYIPDLEIHDSRVKIILCDKKVGGITDAEVGFATKIDELG